MKRILLRIYFIIISFSAFSQNEAAQKAFDSVFYHVAVQVSSSNPIKAMHLGFHYMIYGAFIGSNTN